MRKIALAVGVCALAFFIASEPLRAQDQDPPVRYVTATSFNVPFGPDRAEVMSFLEEYFLPGIQLNPAVRNFRLLTHNWGSNGMTVVMVAEYDNWADIEGDCGQPCDDYFAQHEAPEEGDDGYQEYQEKSTAFNAAYGSHSDEIYTTNMNRAVVEGQMQGTVGPAPESE